MLFLSGLKHVFTGYTVGKAENRVVQSRTILFIASLSLLTASTFAIIDYLFGREWISIMLLVSIIFILPTYLHYCD